MKKLYTTLFILAFTVIANAQRFPVTVFPRVSPPAPVNLYSYADATTLNSPLRVQLRLNDIAVFNRQIRLKVFLEGQGIRLESRNNVIGARPLFIDGGVPLNLTNADLAPYFELQNLQGISPQQYARTLPEGSYQFCFQVFDVARGITLSDKTCAFTVIYNNQPPLLNLPLNEANIEPQPVENIVFQWTPRHINVTNVEYEFSLVEIWDNGVHPQTAFLTTPPLYQTTTRATTLVYGPAQPPLLNNKRYAWRIRAKALQGAEEIGLFRNNGESEIYWFSKTENCATPTGVYAEPKGISKMNVFWDTNPTVFSEYTIAYRKKDRPNSRWFTKTTNASWATLWDLTPNTTYEYKVKGKCTFNYGNYSKTQTLTTNAASDPNAHYNCGIVPAATAITNREGHPKLLIGDRISAGEFIITLTDITSENNGVISGTGFVRIPYLENTVFGVTYSNILVNTDYQLAEGEIVTLYDPVFGEDATLEVEIPLTEWLESFGGVINTLVDSIKDGIDTEIMTNIAIQQIQDVIDDPNNGLPEEEIEKQRAFIANRGKVKEAIKEAKAFFASGQGDDYVKDNLTSNFRNPDAIGSSKEENEGSPNYNDGQYFEKLLQQIRCAYVSGINEINLPEKYKNEEEKLVSLFKYGIDKEEKINGTKISIATVRVSNNATSLKDIKTAKLNSNSPGKLIFGDVEILVTAPSYDWNDGISPWNHFLDYLFPSASTIRDDFNTIWNNGLETKINTNQQIAEKDIEQLKRVATCGTQFFTAEQRFKVIKAILNYNSKEYYEDLVLDIIASIKSKDQAQDLYDRINKDTAFQKLLINNINDITTYLFYDDGYENNLSRFTQEYFKLFKRVYTNQELENKYNSGEIPETHKFFFYGFDYDCDFTLSVGQIKDQLIINEQPKFFDPNLGNTGHCIDKGAQVSSSFLPNEIIAVSIADNDAVLFEKNDGVIVMPALAYYLLIKAANAEELETIINGLIGIIGTITPYDEFYFLSQALKLSSRGLRVAHMGTLKALSRLDNIKVSTQTIKAKDLQKNIGENLQNHVKFLDDLADGVGTYSTKIKWGIHNVDARPFGKKGYWGKRIKQNDPRVEAYELKVNPNNESFYVEHPNGGFVQFENLSLSSLQDGKMILQPNNSFYHVYDKPPFLRQKVLDEAIRQVEAASAKNLIVEWLVSDQKALTQLTQYFSENNVNITVKFLAE